MRKRIHFPKAKVPVNSRARNQTQVFSNLLPHSIFTREWEKTGSEKHGPEGSLGAREGRQGRQHPGNTLLWLGHMEATLSRVGAETSQEVRAAG